MSLGIDLYRSDDYVHYGRLELTPILFSVFEKVLRRDLTGARFRLTFHAVTDGRELDGTPSVVNLRNSHGYVQVCIVRDGVVLYQHPHAVREVFGRTLQKLLREQIPDETHWGFGIAGPGLENLTLVRPAPHNAGSVNLRIRADRPRRFHVEAVAEPDPPPADLAELGAGPVVPTLGEVDTTTAVVVFADDVHEQLLRGLPFSDDVEEGGFLLGQVFTDRDQPGRPLIRIVRALPAERTGASLLQFTFTGESFLRANDVVARLPAGSDELSGRGPVRLVGWYHTHLFAATDNLGLSTIDVDLHSRTFLQRWHVAGLVNIDSGTRTVRVYGWDGTSMRQLSYRVGSTWTP